MFKVEEIGTSNKDTSIFLRGRKKHILGKEEELIRRMFRFPPEDLKEIISLVDGTVYGQSEFFRNVLKLADDGIKEMRISRIGKNLKPYHVTSDLRFYKNGSISGILPQVGLMDVLASRGLRDGGNINCDEEIYPFSQSDDKYLTYLMKNGFLKFTRIEDIRLKEKTPETNFNGQYEELKFDGVLTRQAAPKNALLNAEIIDSVAYQNGSKKIGIKFPENNATFEKLMKDRGLLNIKQNDPYNPNWLADFMKVLYEVIKRARIEVDSIYVDVNVESRSMDSLRYQPKSAMVVLTKNGEKMVTPAPGEQAISLSYLNSKGIKIRDNTRGYVL